MNILGHTVLTLLSNQTLQTLNNLNNFSTLLVDNQKNQHHLVIFYGLNNVYAIICHLFMQSTANCAPAALHINRQILWEYQSCDLALGKEMIKCNIKMTEEDSELLEENVSLIITKMFIS